MQTETLSAEERIARMKARAKATADARREALERDAAVEIAWWRLASDLMESLRALEGIPVVQSFRWKDEEVEGHYQVSIDDRGKDCRLRRVAIVLGKASVPLDCSLIHFRVELDAGNNPVILHDDLPVTPDVALDLATFVVEQHFDNDGEMEDREIPF